MPRLSRRLRKAQRKKPRRSARSSCEAAGFYGDILSQALEMGRQDGDQLGSGGRSGQRITGQRLQPGGVAFPGHLGGGADISLDAGLPAADLSGYSPIKLFCDVIQPVFILQSQLNGQGGLFVPLIIGVTANYKGYKQTAKAVCLYPL